MTLRQRLLLFIMLNQVDSDTHTTSTSAPRPDQDIRWESLLQQISANQAAQTQQLHTIQQRLAILESGTTGKLGSIQHEVRQLKEMMQEMEVGAGGVQGAVEVLRSDLNALRQTWEYRQTTDVDQQEQRLPEVENKVNQITLVLRRVSNQVQELVRTINNNNKAVARNTSELISLIKSEKEVREKPCVEPSLAPTILPPLVNTSVPLPVDCWDTMRQGHNQSGVYQIQPSRYHLPFMALCDMETMGGGWTVLQSRQEGTTNFMRPWREYEMGFGNMAAREFWLGLDKLHLITNARVNDLVVMLKDHTEDSAWAYYEQFAVGSTDQEYAITSLGNYHGTAGDSLRGHVHKFSAEDRDNDLNEGLVCARSGAWWYQDCEDQEALMSNLNGLYLNGSLAQVFPAQGMLWTSWRGLSYSIPHSTMMVRPSADVYKQPALAPINQPTL